MPKPKSYQTHVLALTQELRDALPGLASKEQGGAERMFSRINEKVTSSNGLFSTRVSEDDLARLKKLALRSDDGTWQGWARDTLEHNNIGLTG